jgi:hypothetical protein
MLRAGGEIYHGFPKDMPKISFYEAISSEAARAITCKDFHAVCVAYSRGVLVKDTISAWCITFRGVFSGVVPSHNVKVDPEILSRYRVVINASTGKGIIGTTIPHVRP